CLLLAQRYRLVPTSNGPRLCALSASTSHILLSSPLLNSCGGKMYGTERYAATSDSDAVLDDFMGRIKKIMPSETQDVIATFILFILLPLGFIFEIFAILPQWYETLSEAWVWRVCVLSYLGLNAFTNVYKMIAVGPNGYCSDLPALVKPGYHYCHSCQLNEPPRSHHCPVCDKCALRRDHHCSFAAVCVGHFNQRYYVAAVSNLWIISFATLLWNWSFMWSALGGFSALQLWQLVVPHLALLARVISFSQFLCVMVFVFALTVFLFLTYLIGAQLFCFYRGQTRVEFLMDVHAYQLGFMENVRQALGRRWPLIFLSAFISSPLASDGLSFMMRETASVAETTKNM
uniref:Palmitoyltransferase n=2 Tax=Parascaris univalens TaxID=6257 RepID=A0A914ZI54_PARUN